MSDPSHSDHWQEFWAGTGQGAQDGVCTGAGEALTGFWAERLKAAFAEDGSKRLLELACGAAPVTRQALALGPDALEAVCADISEAAIARLKADLPQVEAHVADAADPPFDPQSFSLVMSQFGLEYAGEGAFAAAGRLVAPDGRLIVVAHLADGAVARECAGNRDILETFLAHDPLAKAAALMREEADLSPQDFQARESEIIAAFRAIEPALAAAAPGGGRELVRRVMGDLAQLYNRRQAFAPDEAQTWLSAQIEATRGYAARMAAMVEAALDEAAIDRIAAALDAGGLRVEARAPISLKPGAEPAAWHVEARRTD